MNSSNIESFFPNNIITHESLEALINTETIESNIDNIFKYLKVFIKGLSNTYILKKYIINQNEQNTTTYEYKFNNTITYYTLINRIGINETFVNEYMIFLNTLLDIDNKNGLFYNKDVPNIVTYIKIIKYKLNIALLENDNKIDKNTKKEIKEMIKFYTIKIKYIELQLQNYLFYLYILLLYLAIFNNSDFINKTISEIKNKLDKIKIYIYNIRYYISLLDIDYYFNFDIFNNTNNYITGLARTTLLNLYKGHILPDNLYKMMFIESKENIGLHITDYIMKSLNIIFNNVTNINNIKYSSIEIFCHMLILKLNEYHTNDTNKIYLLTREDILYYVPEVDLKATMLRDYINSSFLIHTDFFFKYYQTKFIDIFNIYPNNKTEMLEMYNNLIKNITIKNVIPIIVEDYKIYISNPDIKLRYFENNSTNLSYLLPKFLKKDDIYGYNSKIKNLENSILFSYESLTEENINYLDIYEKYKNEKHLFNSNKLSEIPISEKQEEQSFIQKGQQQAPVQIQMMGIAPVHNVPPPQQRMNMYNYPSHYSLQVSTPMQLTMHNGQPDNAQNLSTRQKNALLNGAAVGPLKVGKLRNNNNNGKISITSKKNNNDKFIDNKNQDGTIIGAAVGGVAFFGLLLSMMVK